MLFTNTEIGKLPENWNVMGLVEVLNSPYKVLDKKDCENCPARFVCNNPLVHQCEQTRKSIKDLINKEVEQLYLSSND